MSASSDTQTDPTICRDLYEQAILLAFRDLEPHAKKNVLAFFRSLGDRVNALPKNAAALAIAFPVPPPGSPDTELIALCREFVQMDGRVHATWADFDYERMKRALWAERYAKAAPFAERRNTLVEILKETPATTPEGIYAKARATLYHLSVNAGEDPFDVQNPGEAGLAHSLVLDLLAIRRPA